MSADRRKARIRRGCATLLWLVAWQLAAGAVGQRLLLASPIETLKRLFALARTGAFWSSIVFSMAHILAGFSLAALTGAVFATLSARFRVIEDLLAPLLTAIRSVPVASFVIVALIWMPSKRLSVLVSFLIAFPILYTGALNGLRSIDSKLIEMVSVFRVPPLRRALQLDFPIAFPHFAAAARSAIGLAWKSGVAAEVIGIPAGSIGEKLYKAKVYLATPDLFAWTLTIVLACALCERALELLTRAALRRIEGDNP